MLSCYSPGNIETITSEKTETNGDKKQKKTFLYKRKNIQCPRWTDPFFYLGIFHLTRRWRKGHTSILFSCLIHCCSVASNQRETRDITLLIVQLLSHPSEFFPTMNGEWITRMRVTHIRFRSWDPNRFKQTEASIQRNHSIESLYILHDSQQSSRFYSSVSEFTNERYSLMHIIGLFYVPSDSHSQK